MTRLLLLLALCPALLACSAKEVRFDSEALPVPSRQRVHVGFARIDVVAVTLPTYATSEEIHVRDASGAIKAPGPLWADDPARALTLQIAQELGGITGRLVAPDPWPFQEPPDVRVDVRIADFYATAAGKFRIAGVVYTAPESGGSDRVRNFAIETPIAVPGNPAAIARARSDAVSRLSVLIARSGLR